jgi:hypothetical protein
MATNPFFAKATKDKGYEGQAGAGAKPNTKTAGKTGG